MLTDQQNLIYTGYLYLDIVIACLSYCFVYTIMKASSLQT